MQDEDCSEQTCRQPCPKLRASCGHPCGVPCHAGRECPVSSCGSKVLLTCRCGSRQEQVPCSMKDKKVSVAILAMKQSSEINLSELSKKELQCNENCAQLERNRRMASALDIPNPDLLFELSTTQYSEFLKTLAKKDPVFIAEIERALHDLVEATKECKQERTRSHIFKPMKRDQRQAVHELAELYSCTTVSYDAEPQRNVVAMAHKGKACLPQQTLTSYIRNQQYRRAPMPIPVNASTTDLKLKAQADLQSTTVVKQENRVDYFEMT
ncbi:NFX1 [Bugula neritina]|uniref:NFX1 n=1 Tax=Bugula neritina TaxID=10212 RepID=A0A7J7KLS8_BUGNE|nr:NFX1 [Bugula neritina]